jgi:hypothetical protein
MAPLQLMGRVAQGLRPPVPEAPFPLASSLLPLMHACWTAEVYARPAFDSLLSETDAIVREAEVSNFPSAVFNQVPCVCPSFVCFAHAYHEP